MEQNDFTAGDIHYLQIIGGSLTANTTWSPNNGLDTYLIISSDLVIPKGITLTVLGGVSVEFDFGRYAQVKGSLQAQGTTAAQVSFRGPQSYANPLPGDWNGIVFSVPTSQTVS